MKNDVFNPDPGETNSSDFDPKVLEEFSNKIEEDINIMLDQTPEQDIRGELITVLISVAAQISQEIGMPLEDFVDMSAQFFQDAEETTGEEVVEESNQPDNRILN